MKNGYTLPRKEARILLLIDSTFKYDNISKAQKLHEHIKNRNLLNSTLSIKFMNKFNDYCHTGIPGACCPLCNSFLEGKGRLLCSKCIEELEEITKLPQHDPMPSKPFIPDIPDIPEDDIPPVISTVEEEYTPIEYIQIPKKRFFIGVAAVAAMFVLLGSLHVRSTYFSDSDENTVYISATEVPTGIEINSK